MIFSQVAAFNAPHSPEKNYIDDFESCSPLVSAGCLNHTLQLAINDEIFCQKSVSDLIAKCRSLVSHANHSTTFYNEFYQQQKEQQNITDRLSLKKDCETRWVGKNITFL